MIRDVHHGSESRIRILIFIHPESRILDPEVKKALDLGSRFQIRNTASSMFAN
jgi:hypothetical protein